MHSEVPMVNANGETEKARALLQELESFKQRIDRANKTLNIIRGNPIGAQESKQLKSIEKSINNIEKRLSRIKGFHFSE